MREIKISGLNLYGYFGCFDFERQNGQNFVVNVTMQCDVSEDWITDNLETTVDYSQVAYKCEEFFAKHRFKLLETATYSLCESILLNFDKIQEVTVEIQKPEAPIDLDFDYVSVTTSLKWERVALSIGSNIGDKQGYLDFAISKLKSARGCKNVTASTYVETVPYGDVEQENFLNAAVVLDTYLSPAKLLKVTSGIENEAKRERTVHWGPRTLDIDIVLFGNQIVAKEALRIPHRDMVNREFVLEPLSEIAPYMVNPINNKCIIEMLEEIRANRV